MYSTHLKVITLYENEYLGGNLPLLPQDTHLTELIVFAAHNLYVGANITQPAFFPDNRLCSELPSNFFQWIG